jgi:2-hydroxycyclohexanecarboxyl-CoA dehydrogenase
MIDLTGRVAVVFGAGSGVGRATALTMARLGARVAAADRDPLAVAGTAVLGERDGQIRDYVVDIADPAAVEATRQAVERDLGVPHIVVQADGWDRATTVVDERRDEVAEATMSGTASTVRSFLDAMIRRGRGGRVITVAGDAGEATGAPHGVAAFSTSLARELAPYGILVNCVSPGPTDTPLFAAQPQRTRVALERAIPLRRVAQPEEVAAAITFFASDEASFVTGQVLSVSGGLTMPA